MFYDKFSRTDTLTSYSYCPSVPCGVCIVATKRNYIEILSFKHFHKHFVFVREGEKTRNKVLKNHITVSVVIDQGMGTQ